MSELERAVDSWPAVSAQGGEASGASLYPSRRTSRVIGLDAARVLATFGIVWVHVAEIQGQDERLNTLGRFGTSFYILAAVFLAARSHFHRAETRTRDVARKRAKRLLIPYALWCAIYALFYFGTMYPQGYSIEAITRYWGPLFGTAPHLWFLPFAFVSGVAASLAVPRLKELPAMVLVPLGVVCTLGAYIYVYNWGFATFNQPVFDQLRLHRISRWAEETPMVIGAIFGFSIYGKYLKKITRMGPVRRRTFVIVGLLGFLITQISYAVFLETLGEIFWNRLRFFANIAGAFWMVTFLASWQGKMTRALAPLGAATYFAYLSHQMILDSVKRLLTFLPGYGSLWFAFLSSVAIFFAAVGLGLLVSRVKLLRWLSP